MKILYLEPVGGIAGDMTVAALLELGVPLAHLRQGLAQSGLERFAQVAIGSRPESRGQIAGTRFVVTVTTHDGRRLEEEPHHHSAAQHQGQPHGHPPHPSHGHRHYSEIKDWLAASGLPEGPKAIAQSIFAKLAQAEAAVHGVAPEQVAFHEVGAADALADVVCMALALDWLGVQAVFCATVPLGRGTVQTAHGELPIPAPATLRLLEGFDVTPGPLAYERTTPTGAALLAAVARPAPAGLAFTPLATGHGLGQMDPPGVANLLRATLAEYAPPAPHGAAEPASEPPLEGLVYQNLELAEAAIDDATPEWLAHLAELLLQAGCLDVIQLPALMKKGRAATLLQALYPPALRPTVQRLLLTQSTSLGLRHYPVERAALARRAATVQTPWGPLAGKAARLPGGERFYPEYGQAAQLAQRHGLALPDVYAAAQAAWAKSQTE